jgi:general secretion pathway protein I
MSVFRQKRLKKPANISVYGFTLLEAIVALVILTTAGLALFSWINASFDSLNRIEVNNTQAAAEINALEYLKTVNPMLRPDGETKLGEITMRWRARAVSDVRPNLTDAQTLGQFVVALYDTEVELVPSQPSYRFKVRQMGYQRNGTDEELLGDGPNQNLRSPIAPRTR